MTDRPAPLVHRPRAIALPALAVGLGVLLLAWHAQTLRLDVDGANLAWPAIVAFAMAWSAPGRAPWRTATSMVVGASGALVAFYASLQLLPVTPMGVGIGLGAGATLLAVAGTWRADVLPLGPLMAGYGVGIASSRLVDVSVGTGASDVVAALTAVAFATIVGVLGAVGLRSVTALARRPRSAPVKPTNDARGGIDTSILEPVRRMSHGQPR